MDLPAVEPWSEEVNSQHSNKSKDNMYIYLIQNSDVAIQAAEQPTLLSTELFALTIALLAVIFGPIVQYFIARKQINSKVLSNNRQEWINTLRESIAQFNTNFSLYLTHLELRNRDESNKMGFQSNLYRERIKLLINPKESDHRTLIEEIESLDEHVQIFIEGNQAEKERIKAEVEEIQNRIIEISQVILKREWERVKDVK